MGMTMSEKILAKHAGLDSVKAGQLVTCELDMVLANDITAPPSIAKFEEIGRPVFDNTKIALVPDHFQPAKDIKSAELAKIVRDFARKYKIVNYFEQGRVGIEHVILPEKGIVAPGMLTIGADSHTCTYGAVNGFSTGVGSTDLGAAMATGKAWFKVPEAIKVNLMGEKPADITGKDVILTIIGMIGVDGALYKSLEFAGPGVKALTMTDRLTISNMAIEAGGKAGIFPFDEITKAYVDGRVRAQAGRCLPAPAGQHEARRGHRGAHRDRSGHHRFLHEWPPRGHGDRSVRPQGTQGRRPRALHRHPGQPCHLQGVDEARLHRCLHRCRLCRLDADLWPVPRRLHGYHGCRRALRLDDEPQFPWPHGPCRQ